MPYSHEITPLGREYIDNPPRGGNAPWVRAKDDRPVIHVAGGHASGFVAQAIKDRAEKIGARIVGRLDLPPRRAAAPSLSPAA